MSQARLAAHFPVSALTHNEVRHFSAGFERIFEADPYSHFEVYGMANLCTDRAKAIAQECGRRRSEVYLVSIKLGDNCEGWNVFVHDAARPAALAATSIEPEGSDGTIDAFVKWDLWPRIEGSDDERIVVYPYAGFRFEPFMTMRVSDGKVYRKRSLRYGPLIEERGLGAIPRGVTEDYPKAEVLTLRWQRPYNITNWYRTASDADHRPSAY